MAIPGGYSRAQALALYSGVPAEYQQDGYVASAAVNASSSQKSGLQTLRAAKAHHMTWDEVEQYLASHT